mgnify:CR=1 FL=1
MIILNIQMICHIEYIIDIKDHMGCKGYYFKKGSESIEELFDRFISEVRRN